MERNRLINGRFYNDLNGWTVSGAVYSAGDGDDHYGVTVLETGGEYIEQDFAVVDPRTYSLHISTKSTTGFTGSEVQAVITDGNRNTVASLDLESGAGAWVENTHLVGLVPGTTYTLKIINNSAGEDVKIDDVWIWFVPITRANIAGRVEYRIQDLANDRELSTAENGADTEGDYTHAVDAGLRTVNAINPETGAPDVRYLNAADVEAVIDAAEREMMIKLQRAYALLHDVTAGPVTQRYSQISDGIRKMTASGGAAPGSKTGGRVEIRKLTNRNG